MTNKLVLEGNLKIVNEWDDPYEVLLDDEGLLEIIIERFGLEPEEYEDCLGLWDYGPFDFGKVRITIERRNHVDQK